MHNIPAIYITLPDQQSITFQPRYQMNQQYTYTALQIDLKGTTTLNNLVGISHNITTRENGVATWKGTAKNLNSEHQRATLSDVHLELGVIICTWTI